MAQSRELQMSGGLVMKTISRASNTPVLAHRSDDAAPRHATAPDLTKNSSDEKEPFSLPEFAAGSIAAAAVWGIPFPGSPGGGAPKSFPPHGATPKGAPPKTAKPR